LLDVARSAFVHGMQVGLRVSSVIAVAIAVVVWRWYPTGHLRPSGSRKLHVPAVETAPAEDVLERPARES
jgi:hypothetical protein